MKIYLDVIFLLNFFFDFIILLCVSLILRRNIKLRRILLGSFIGSLSIFILFIKLNNISLFLFKILLSTLICIITYSFKDIKYFLNNLLYFFTTSIILGGFLYFIKININYKNIGIVFINKEFDINILFLVIFSPLILYIYIKQAYKLKNHYSLYHKVDIYLKNGKIISLNGYMDTANNMIEPYHKRAVIIINNKRLNKYLKNEKFILVPYDTVNSHGLIKCFVPKKIYIKGMGIKKDVVIGITKNDFNIDGVNCILNNKLQGG